MAIVLDNDLMTRWLEIQRQINAEQVLRDEAKERDEKGLDLKARIAELEAEVELLEMDVEMLNEQIAAFR